MIAALSAGGVVIVIIMIVICLIGLLIATPFGLFFSGDSGAEEDTVQTAVARLNDEYYEAIERIQTGTSHDNLDLSSDIDTAVADNWRNVLAVYAVRVTTDEISATEVVTIDDEKMGILREIFWDMTQLSSHTTSRTRNAGTDHESTSVTLHISVSVKSAEETAEEYGFNDTQMNFLEELLNGEYDELFDTLLSGVQTSF